LNAPEKRHAHYQGDFKWAVHSASRKWSILWEKYHIVTLRQRIRMLDDSLTAEMFGILLEGVKDGGQPNIDKLYKRNDDHFEDERRVGDDLDKVLSFFVRHFADALANTPLLGAPHFLILFAALAHRLIGISPGDLGNNFLGYVREAPWDLSVAIGNLKQIAEIIASDEPPEGFEAFWRASRSSTQRIASRRVRFPTYYSALLPQPLAGNA
jgi:hypothetical protein